jgi:hypothetical protein
MFAQLLAVEDPGGTGPYNSSTGITSCVLQVMAAPTRIWVAKFSVAYASVPVTAFTGNHGFAAGDIVIVVATDIVHAWLLGLGGTTDMVF